MSGGDIEVLKCIYCIAFELHWPSAYYSTSAWTWSITKSWVALNHTIGQTATWQKNVMFPANMDMQTLCVAKAHTREQSGIFLVSLFQVQVHYIVT